MPLSPPQSSHRTGSRRSWRRRAAGTVAALLFAAGGTVAATGPAHAANNGAGSAHAAQGEHAIQAATAGRDATQGDCLAVKTSATSWRTGPDSGGLHRNITITNTCATAVTGWTLTLTLPPGHTLQQGWNASWSSAGSTLTARPAAWNDTVPAGGSVFIGYLGTWTGSPQEPGCAINGAPCDETPQPAPKVALTSPTEGAVLVSVCAVRLTAEATVQVGTIDRVEFYLNDQLVGSDAQAPYEINIPPSHPALTSSGPHTAFARVVTASPAASADSPVVSFAYAPPPPALMVIPCPSQVEVAEGSSTTITFVTICSGTPGLRFTVTGHAGVSVTPTYSPPGAREHQVTVSAAHGSGGARALINATTDTPNCSPASALVTVS
ncbi:cellulose binding domain-containing protein [Micromonospora sp. FIMYZ51]|uniref:cellulose binding domain-containing protein n=1 Tax=Micromonospora sp. FIMYZ51 TaxID=3051832 RepID=UPI00311FBC4F